MSWHVCVVTGTRAEYGLLSPLLALLRDDDAFRLSIVATGAHLSEEYGLTYTEIEADGFEIADKVEILAPDDSELSMATATGTAIVKLSKSFARLNPDIVLVLGDRYEILAAASAAFMARIPVAHLHGGELTAGALDDSMRHSVTKMSMLHFTATEEYRQRVIQLGEDPERVFNVGALGIDNAKHVDLIGREELEQKLGLALGPGSMMVTFHPATATAAEPTEAFAQLLAALDRFEGYRVVFTKPNADTGGRGIATMTDEYVSAHADRARAFTSLGHRAYLSAVREVDVVVGNSSSGIIEVPAMGKPTVNIGDRQQGRVRAASVIDCEPDEDAIAAAIERALSDEFREACLDVENPYGDGETAERIVAILKEQLPHLDGVRKEFHDVR